jgi:hypothetical protein
MATDFIEADAKREVAALAALLGDTRVRFHHRETRLDATEKLMEVDRQIRGILTLPLSAEMQSEVQRLTAHLRALDPRTS